MTTSVFLLCPFCTVTKPNTAPVKLKRIHSTELNVIGRKLVRQAAVL